MNKALCSVVGTLLVLTGCSSGKTSRQPERAAESKRAPEKTPEQFHVQFDTSKGKFVVEVNREWAPRGADRFYELVNEGFYDGARFFRVRRKFVAQFGISKDPKRNELWSQLKMPDDPVKKSNLRGYLSFAMRGPSTRTTQVFINLGDNAAMLDAKGFAPFGKVVEGLDVVDNLYAVYGEVSSLGGAGPDPSRLEVMGDEYAKRNFPRLDTIQKASLLLDYKPVEGDGEASKPNTPAQKTKQ